MDIHSVRQQLRTKSIYDIPLRVTYYARVSSESRKAALPRYFADKRPVLSR